MLVMQIAQCMQVSIQQFLNAILYISNMKLWCTQHFWVHNGALWAGK